MIMTTTDNENDDDDDDDDDDNDCRWWMMRTVTDDSNDDDGDDDDDNEKEIMRERERERERWCGGKGARFSTVPKTFRARKAICETVNRLFRKADLLKYFQGNRKQNGCKVWRLKSSPFNTEGIVTSKNGPLSFGTFEKRARGLMIMTMTSMTMMRKTGENVEDLWLMILTTTVNDHDRVFSYVSYLSL